MLQATFRRNPAVPSPSPRHLVASRGSPFAALALWLVASLPAAMPRPQQPEPAPPPPARVQGAEAKDLDPKTVNLDWENVSVADLPLLARFPGLRRLQVNPNTDAGEGPWQNVTADALAPVCALSALEDLTLPYCARLAPEHLRRLAACKRLASVLILNQSLTLDADAVGALATWPALRSLRLSLIPVTPAGLAALTHAAKLDTLELQDCLGLDDAGWAALCKLTNLRVLSLSGLGKPNMLAMLTRQDNTPTWALTTAALQQLAALPALRELELKECVLAPRLLAALPPKLVALTLHGNSVDAQSLQDLRRHSSLRTLQLREAGTSEGDCERFRREVAALLGALHLERFSWFGALSVDLRQAIAGQADLRELTVPCGPGLEFAAALPKLERLELWQRAAPQQGDGANVPAAGHAAAADRSMVAEFGVLQASKSLRVVVYHDAKLPAELAAGLREALGPKIALQLVE